MLNSSQLKTLAVFSVFAIIGFGPISPGCLIGMFTVLFRPAWFWTLVNGIYVGKSGLHKPDPSSLSEQQIFQQRKKCFLSLLGLFIIDIAPVPVTPVIAFVLILSRPLWFYRRVAIIYAGSNA